MALDTRLRLKCINLNEHGFHNWMFFKVFEPPSNNFAFLHATYCMYRDLSYTLSAMCLDSCIFKQSYLEVNNHWFL